MTSRSGLAAGARALGVDSVQVYLQGLPVSIGTGHPMDTHNVVHLDPRRFTGRMPDRSALVDQDDAKRQVRATVENAWKARLRGLKAELSAEDFAALAYPTALMWGCLELFDDLEDLPPQVLDSRRCLPDAPVRVGGRQQRVLRAAGVPPPHRGGAGEGRDLGRGR